MLTDSVKIYNLLVKSFFKIMYHIYIIVGDKYFYDRQSTGSILSLTSTST